MNSYKQSLYAGAIRIAANVAMLGAVFIAMRQASRVSAWPSEAVFLLFFLGITIPAWTAAIFTTRWIRKKWPAEGESLVHLPKIGQQLTRWRVVEADFRAPARHCLWTAPKDASLNGGL